MRSTNSAFPSDGFHRIIAGEIGQRHAGARIVGLFRSIMRQGLRHRPPLHAGDFIQRLIRRKAGLHALDEFRATQINLALQMIPNARQANASPHKINIPRDCTLALPAKLAQ
ncbi:hypothetical protein [Methylocaldum sp. 14B]|uniref:hypothetical protein n=1 Tax=unclassified Methylocaldum TaxID=2622260 RepID=UPI001F0B31EF|nr:hypothetical protein [Methylocaldum sp. 14B]